MMLKLLLSAVLISVAFCQEGDEDQLLIRPALPQQQAIPFPNPGGQPTPPPFGLSCSGPAFGTPVNGFNNFVDISGCDIGTAQNSRCNGCCSAYAQSNGLQANSAIGFTHLALCYCCVSNTNFPG
ncbi:hypothetical protein WR25_16753 [Diploscapter pachys]|uniref:Uncharacterized protein n=1 Tax=Diploscapter pachys TaxID=2018661 RepID=A0A2A2M2Z1_9BILA|nr:hypothetical protein WR25_16753 [Diploscapter pachys]